MYQPQTTRYQQMPYNRCGNSGLLLPSISLGLWHNFGNVDDFENARTIIHKAFDCGITHFDLANNYGPPPGEAEVNFGKILKQDFLAYRDELIISTKAGYGMWPGPYGEWGSRKYLIASCNQSLQRMGLDYVDIFYSHRYDPNTPLEETMGALDYLVRSGKALYIGISSYNAEQTTNAIKILNQLGTPCLIHQPRYSMLDRWVEEDGLLNVLQNNGVGCIAFSPLAQGLLSNKYLQGIPNNSRVGRGLSNGAITNNSLEPKTLQKIQDLNTIAVSRNQTLSQMALAWILKDKRVTSVVIGASKVEQLIDNINYYNNAEFTTDELQNIESILKA
jgi:L-glyceraldehyde 3-phosphate reductase